MADYSQVCGDTVVDRDRGSAVCDLPAGHLDEPHNDDHHQQCGGPRWRYVDGRAEFD